MKKWLFWISLAVMLMIGCPWLAVTFAGSAGMAICFILFFGVNPLFCILCGGYAGRNIKGFWPLPCISTGLFLAGVWTFFEMGEPAFLLYAAVYLLLGMAAMLLSSLIRKKQKKTNE